MQKLWILEFPEFRCGESKRKRKNKRKERDYEKNREKIIETVKKSRKENQEAKSGRGRCLRKKNASINEVAKKNRHERKQQKIASEMKEKLEKERRMARERSKRYRQKQKDRNAHGAQAEAIPIEVTGTPFPNRMAKKCAVGRAKKSLPDTPEKKAEIMVAITESPRTRKVLKKTRTYQNARRGKRSRCTKSAC